MVCANVKLNNNNKKNIIYYSVYTQGKLLTHSDQRNIGIRDFKSKKIIIITVRKDFLYVVNYENSPSDEDTVFQSILTIWSQHNQS